MRTKRIPPAKKVQQIRPHIFEQRLSPYQYALLREAASSSIVAGAISMTTFGPLVKRGMVSVDGEWVTVLAPGMEALETYIKGSPPLRSRPGELTEAVQLMLGIIQRRNGREKEQERRRAS